MKDSEEDWMRSFEAQQRELEAPVLNLIKFLSPTARHVDYFFSLISKRKFNKSTVQFVYTIFCNNFQVIVLYIFM